METVPIASGEKYHEKWRGVWPYVPLIVLAFLYVVFLVLSAVSGSDWSNFKVHLMIWFLSFLGLFYLLLRSPLIRRLEAINPAWMAVLIFLLTLLLHLPFLLSEPSMSQDILRLGRRGELLMDGNFPYRDFDVNKPPLYIWMVGLLSLPFGAEQIVFRTAFSIANALIPTVMFLIHRGSVIYDHGVKKGPFGISVPNINWMAAALGYSLCPITLIETGVGGHFDPVVVLTSVLAFLFLIRKRPTISALFLGMGFALKLYPAFLAPIFFLSIPGWKDRTKFVGAFFVIPVLASLPVLFVDPALIGEYLRYQFVNWYSGFSIRYLLEIITSSVSLSGKAAYYVMTAVLLLGTVYLLLRGLAGRIKRIDTSVPFTLLLLLSFMGVALSSAFFFRGARTAMDLVSAVVSGLYSILLIGAGVYLFLHWRPIGKPEFQGLYPRSIFIRQIGMEWVPLLSSCILLLVVLTSAQFHPWYIAWILPFSMASGNTYWSWSTLLLLSSLQYNYYPPWEIGLF